MVRDVSHRRTVAPTRKTISHIPRVIECQESTLYDANWYGLKMIVIVPVLEFSLYYIFDIKHVSHTFMHVDWPIKKIGNASQRKFRKALGRARITRTVQLKTWSQREPKHILQHH